MPRLSIELTPEQHKRLKAIAALRGQSLKDYVLQRSLEEISLSEEEALRQLEAFLRPRLEEAESGKPASKSAREILDAVRKTA